MIIINSIFIDLRCGTIKDLKEFNILIFKLVWSNHLNCFLNT